MAVLGSALSIDQAACVGDQRIQGVVDGLEARSQMLGALLERLRALPYSIGMAASREKVPAILGALRGHYINVLITDEETAKILLNE